MSIADGPIACHRICRFQIFSGYQTIATSKRDKSLCLGIIAPDALRRTHPQIAYGIKMQGEDSESLDGLGMREGLELASLRMIEIKSHLRSYRHIAILHLDGGKTHLAFQEGMRDSGVPFGGSGRFCSALFSPTLATSTTLP